MIALAFWSACGEPGVAPWGTWYLLRSDLTENQCPPVPGDDESRKQRNAVWEGWNHHHETAVLELLDAGGGAAGGVFATDAAVEDVDGLVGDGLGTLQIGRDEAMLTWTGVTVDLVISEVAWFGHRCTFEDRCDDRCYVE
ncbi:MAG: hypothetical protein ABMA64_28890 [Myxococcota bacterium]